MASKENATNEEVHSTGDNINETIVEASKAGIRALLELSNTPVAFVDVSKVDIAPRYISTNEAAKQNKAALAPLTSAVRSKATVPETVEVEDDGSAWFSQPFGKYRIYALVKKEDRRDTGEVERLREELGTEKRMVETYRKAYEDMKFELSDTARQCRTMVNGAIGLSEMLMENIQAKASVLTRDEANNMTEMASMVKAVSSNAIEVLGGVYERQDKIHRIIEPTPPPPPQKIEPRVLKSWHKEPPRPEKNELIYENVPIIRVLVVEDNLVNQKVLCKIMTKGKVKEENIVIADTSDKALQILDVDPHFDLVWVDQTMTPMLGVELIEHIMKPERRMNYPPWFTVVGMLVCYFRDDPSEKRMRDAGATDVIFKPVRLGWVWGHCLRVAELKKHANLPMLPWKL